MLIAQDHNHNKNNKDFLPKVLLLQVPSSSAMLMLRIYYDVIPRVHKHLKFWKKKAERIPNPELRKQALLYKN
jgi:tetraprenyl-beta-curcumene synthase